jgi:nucleoside-diphosphate-sugar epimerase
MKILITGAGGFLGFHIAKALVEQGHEVTNFSRQHYKKLDDISVKSIQGDLRDREAVEDAVHDQDAIFHVASKVGVWGSYKDFYDINVKGTKNVILAAKREKVDKLIFTSSPSAIFGVENLCGVDENYPYPQKYVSHYAKTKALAEEEILKAHDPQRLKTIALRPHLVFGPGDHNLIPRVINKAKKNKLKIIGSGDNIVDVLYIDNAVHAHLLALEKLDSDPKVGGQAFFISQEKPVKLWSFINTILDKNKFTQVKSKVPFALAYGVGFFLEKVMFWSQNEPPLTRFVALNLSKSHYFNNQKSHNLLEYQPIVSLEDSIEKTTQWMRSNGLSNISQ